MKSVMATSLNIDDTEQATAELLAQIDIPTKELRGAVGFLYYDYEADGELLAANLHSALGIDIVSGGSVGLLLQRGYVEMGISLLVLYGENFEYSLLNVPLGSENAEDFTALYHTAAAALTAPPTFIYALFTECVFEQVETLLCGIHQISGGLPLFGGLPCSSEGALAFKRSYFVNGQNLSYLFSLVLIHAPTFPLFSVGNALYESRGKMGKVTKSHKATLFEVNHRPFTHFLETNGYLVNAAQKHNYKMLFHKYPLMVWPPEAPQNAFTVRTPFELNFEDGSVNLLCHVPEKSSVCFTELTHESIESTTRSALKNLLTEMAEKEKQGCRYSTIFCISCEGRYQILNPFYELEGRAIRELVPPHLNLIGYYSQGEFCPLQHYSSHRKSNNLFHNCSIAFCAI